MNEEKEKQSTEEKEEKRKKWILLLLLLILLFLLLTLCILIFRYKNPIKPDYPPQGMEANQEMIDGDKSEKMDSPEGGGAINVTYGMDVTVDLSEEKVSFYYANPNSSNQNVAVSIQIEDLVVAKSDLIAPGNQLKELPLEEYAKERLQIGGYDAKLVVRAYDPESGEKAMVDTNGSITVTVVE